MLRRLASSAGAFAWAGSLFVARQAATTARAWAPGADAGPRRRASAAFDAVAWSAGGGLDGLGREVYEAFDALQRDLVALVTPADPWRPADWLRSVETGAALAWESRRFLPLTPAAGAIPGAGTTADAWRELACKAEVYATVRRIASLLELPPPGEPLDLAAAVGRAYGLGEHVALWAVEGLGHDAVLHGWPPGGAPPRGFLRDGPARELPAESRSMLHAGLGLAIAQRLLAELPPGAPPERLRDTVAEVLRLCRDNSRDGYAEAAVEALGLVTRTFHGDRVDAVDAALEDLGEATARDTFWHGVGRALYFLPVNTLPLGDATWRPWRMAAAEAPDPRAHANARAGLAFSFTMVHLRRPELMERLLLVPHGDALAAEPGFAHGVASAVLLRQDTTPGAAVLEGFLGHRPVAAADAWWRLVAEPGRRAVEETWPRMRREGRLDGVFVGADGIGTVGAEPAEPAESAGRAAP